MHINIIVFIFPLLSPKESLIFTLANFDIKIENQTESCALDSGESNFKDFFYRNRYSFEFISDTNSYFHPANVKVYNTQKYKPSTKSGGPLPIQLC